jgi:hypothetical protein
MSRSMIQSRDEGDGVRGGRISTDKLVQSHKVQMDSNRLYIGTVTSTATTVVRS